MRTKLTLTILALGTTAAMALAVGTASANRLSTSSSEFYLIWSSLELIPPVGSTIRCAVTLLGSFHSRTFSKVRESLIGAVTHVELSEERGIPCTGGRMTVLHETLPWHVRYLAFAGTLPLIVSVQTGLVGARFRIANGSATCNMTSTAANPVKDHLSLQSGGSVESVTAEGSIPTEGEFFCELATSSFSGNGSVKAERAGANNITVKLI